MVLKWALILLGLSLPLLSHGAWYSEEQDIMGTTTGVMFEVEDETQGPQLADAVFAEFKRFDRIYSSYSNDSMLSLVNQKAAQGPQKISDEFLYLIGESLEFYEQTQGLFDITYAAVGNTYDYRKGLKPSAAGLQAKLHLIDSQGLRLNLKAKTLEFSKAGMRIDLGGVGKGYVVDQAIEILKASGVQHASVFAGGDRRFHGLHGDRPWMMGIRHPRDPKRLALKMPIHSAAVSTSGDYERYFIDDEGLRHHHIVHPKTGESPREVVSATVIGKEAMITDAMSTSVLLAGVQEGLQLIDAQPDLEVVVIDHQGKVHYSSGLVSPATHKEGSTQ